MQFQLDRLQEICILRVVLEEKVQRLRENQKQEWSINIKQRCAVLYSGTVLRNLKGVCVVLSYTCVATPFGLEIQCDNCLI